MSVLYYSIQFLVASRCIQYSSLLRELHLIIAPTVDQRISAKCPPWCENDVNRSRTSAGIGMGGLCRLDRQPYKEPIDQKLRIMKI